MQQKDQVRNLFVKKRKNVTFDGDIIIIIEAIDAFKDYDTGMETNLKFWLPKMFPENVRFIITADKDSDSHTYLTDLGCDTLQMIVDNSSYDSMIQSCKARESLCNEQHHTKCFEIIEKKLADNEIDNPLFIKTFCSTFCPYSSRIMEDNDDHMEDFARIISEVDYSRFESITTTEELMHYVLEYFEDRIMKREKFQKCLCCLVLTFKGLTYTEINRVIKFEGHEWILIRTLFKSFFFTFKGFWKISNDIFKKAIKQKYLTDNEYMRQIHCDISNALDKTPNSIRKLEEKTNHLYFSKDPFALKQTLSCIEVFLLLFNPFTKYDLCRYWQTLEECGYDPVVEYNKGLELFDMHYSPKAEDLFTIIQQISRFLKEFTDFETKFTPEFRHPFIKGKIIQLRDNDTNKSDEDNQNGGLMSIFKSSKQAPYDGEMHANAFPFKDNDIEVSVVDSDDGEPEIAHNKINYLEDIGLYREIKKLNMTEKTSHGVISGHEKFNVDVPSGRAKFLEYFNIMINEKKIKKNFNVDPNENNKADFEVDDKQIEEEKFGKEGKMEILKVETNKSFNKDVSQQIIDDIDQTIEPERQGSFYYYKRWIWMIFPWVCMSVSKKQTFSELIAKCYSSNIRYQSVEEEKLFTKHAIKIVIETKVKKKMMYANKPEEGDELKTQKTEVFKSQFIVKSQSQSQMSIPNQPRKSLNQQNMGNLTNNSGTLAPLGPIRHSNKTSMMNLNTSIPSNIGESTFLTEANQKSIIGQNSEKKHTLSTNKLESSQLSSTANLNNKISQILDKSKFWEGRLKMSGYEPEVKSILLQNKNKSSMASLSKLHSTLNNFTNKEMSLLERKNDELIKEYNRLINEFKLKKKKIETHTLTEREQVGPDPQIDIKMQEDVLELSISLAEIEKKVIKAQEQKKRLQRIIEICEINKIQNEEWIRGLNYYITNQRKVIKYERTDIKVIETEVQDYAILAEHFVKNYNSGMKNHNSLLKNIETFISNQKEIDSRISGTNELIYESVDLKKKKYLSDMIKNKEKKENQKMNILNEKRKQQVYNELEELKSQHELVKEIFENEDEVDWCNKQKFTNLLENLDTRRDLLKHQLELNSQASEKEDTMHELQDHHDVYFFV